MDLFANKAGGFNAFCVGMTGAGKSVWLQWIALNYFLSGNKIWIIDIGGSYQKLCEIFGGQYIDFKRNSGMSVNPFTDIVDTIESNGNKISGEELLDEYLEFLTSLYLLMGLPKEITLSEQLEKLMKGYLIEAITTSYKKFKNESEVDTVVAELVVINKQEEDPRLSDFIKHLAVFKKGNIYGSFLNGKSNVTFRSKMTVLEAGELESTPDLLNVILMVLTYQISKEIYLKKNKDVDERNIVIMDEAHKFLGSSPHIDLFIEQAYRRFRKDGASMILGTQGFEDLYGGNEISKVGRVIIENSYWNFFLMQKSTSREKIKKSGYFNLSQYEEALMDTTEPADGEYGEVLILSDKITTKGRIVLDDFLKVMLFTNAEMRIRINQMVASGMTYLEAVNRLKEES
jgi:conjugal transfer ATP-binding protein TraC